MSPLGQSAVHLDTVPEPLLGRAQAVPWVLLEWGMARPVVIPVEPAK